MSTSSFFTYTCPFVEHHYFKRPFFSLLNYLDSFVKNQLGKCVRACVYKISGLYSVRLIYMSILLPVPHCLEYYIYNEY